MTKELVKFQLCGSPRGVLAYAELQAAQQAFGLSDKAALALQWPTTIICRTDQFAHFLICLYEYGSTPDFHVLRPRFFTPEILPNTLDVSKEGL